MPSQRAVVTGGAGFIGANLVDRLIDDGADVLVVDDLSSGMVSRLSSARKRGNLTFHQMDIRAEELENLIVGYSPDTVFHLAAQIDVRVSVAEPSRDADINIVGTINVIEAAIAADVDRLVFASSGGATFGETTKLPTPESVRRRPESPYGVSKGVADAYLDYYHRKAGLEYVSLGFANVYGPKQDPHGEAGVVAIFAADLLAGRTPTIYGDGGQTRDFVFVEDVADALLRAASVGGDRYFNVGTGTETTVVDLYWMIAAAAGVDTEPMFAPARPGEQERSCLDASAATKALGWEPWTPLDQGIQTTVDWFAANR